MSQGLPSTTISDVIQTQWPIIITYPKRSNSSENLGLLVLNRMLNKWYFFQLKKTSKGFQYEFSLEDLKLKKAHFRFYQAIFTSPKSKEPDPRDIALAQKGLLPRIPYSIKIENQKVQITILDWDLVGTTQTNVRSQFFATPSTIVDSFSPNSTIYLFPKHNIDHSINALVKNLQVVNQQWLSQWEHLSEETRQQRIQMSHNLIQKAKQQLSENPDESLSLCQKAWELAPHEPDEAIAVAIQAAHNLDNYILAVALWEIFQPPNPEAQMITGKSYWQLRKLSEAREIFKKLSSYPDYQAKGFYWLGILEYENQNWDQAYFYFRKALTLSQSLELDEAISQYLQTIEAIQDPGKWHSFKQTGEFTGSLGLLYNSNILQISNDFIPQSLASYQSMWGLGFFWQPWSSRKRRFNFNMELSSFYSVNESGTRTNLLHALDTSTLMTQVSYQRDFPQLGLTFDQNLYWRSLSLANSLNGWEKQEFLSQWGMRSQLTWLLSPDVLWRQSIWLRHETFRTPVTQPALNPDGMIGGIGNQIVFTLFSPRWHGRWDNQWQRYQPLGQRMHFHSYRSEVTFSWTPSQKSRLEAYWSFMERTFPYFLPFRKDSNYLAGINFNYLINRSLSLSASVQHQRNESNINSANFDQWLITMVTSWQAQLERH